MKEIWKDVPGYEGVYKVSNKGRLYSLKRFKVLKPYTNKCGYKMIMLQRNKVSHYTSIHRLVASAFLPNPNSLPQVNHKDENPSNNNVENLEWCTAKYNINYGNRNRKVSDKALHISQYTKDNKFVAEYPSISYIVEAFGYNESPLYKCCQGTRKSAYGYIWKYTNGSKNTLQARYQTSTNHKNHR